MKLSKIKVSAVILSTLIIGNKYPAGDKSFLFTPVYAIHNTIERNDLQKLGSSVSNILSIMKRKEKNSYEIPKNPLNNVNQIAYHHLTDFIIKNGEYINSIPIPKKIEDNRGRYRNPKHLSNSDLVSYIKKRLNNLQDNNSKPEEDIDKDIHKLYGGLCVLHTRLSQAIPTPPKRKAHVVHQVPPNNIEDDDSLTSDINYDDSEDGSQIDADNTSNLTIFENDSQFDEGENDEECLNPEHYVLKDDGSIEALQPISNDNSRMLSSSSNNDHNRLTPMFHSIIHKTRTLLFPQISRKVRGDKDLQRIVGASSNNYIQRYELDVKYLYSTATIPKTNGKSKSNIHGLLINFKRQMTSKFTAGVFYSPTIANTTFTYKISNNSYAREMSGNTDHLFGIYTSYAIAPVTYLSNQIALGVTMDDNNANDKKYLNYFVIDSFLSHKINIDASKTIAPEFGLSYYSSNSPITHNSNNINNLSLITGIKLQYQYQHNNVEFCPSIKLSHVHHLYSNIAAQESATGPSIDLLRDFKSAFDSHSSIRCSFAVRYCSIRLEGSYGFTVYHNIDHNYAHTLSAKLNLSL